MCSVLTAGRYPLGPATGELVVHTSRSGLGARAGHDLTIEASDWEGELTVDNDGGARVAVRVPVTGLHVREGHGGVKPLSDRDRADIERTMREKILDAAAHPTIEFAAPSGAATSGTLPGTLTVRGVTQPLEVTVTVTEGDATVEAHASAQVVQSRWGITPYSAFFGALRLADAVAVEARVTLRPAE